MLRCDNVWLHTCRPSPVRRSIMVSLRVETPRGGPDAPGSAWLAAGGLRLRLGTERARMSERNGPAGSAGPDEKTIHVGGAAGVRPAKPTDGTVVLGKVGNQVAQRKDQSALALGTPA